MPGDVLMAAESPPSGSTTKQPFPTTELVRPPEGHIHQQHKKERNISWLLLACLPLGTWPAAQACALTGNQTGDPLVCMALNPLTHTSQGSPGGS